MTAFAGFPADGLAFLAELAARQERDWFNANKGVYETALRAPMAALLLELSGRLQARELPLEADPKRAIFRIHRDVRFSNDKRPYKTHIGAVLSRDGAKASGGGIVYIHIDPAGSFMAAGFYMPAPDALAGFRQSMLGRPDRWRAVADDLAGDGLKLDREGALSRLPRGIDPPDDPALADDLKLKSLVVSRPADRDRIGRPEFADDVVHFALAARPLLEWGWRALGRG